MKEITIGIPVYNAINTLKNTLSSILLQSIYIKCQIILCQDGDNLNYNYFIEMFPELDIKIIQNNKNQGPGVSRQRILDYCSTDYITFIDADDLFTGYYSLESLYVEMINNTKCVMVQGEFLEEKIDHSKGLAEIIIRHNDIEQPWVFGRLYRVNFLKENNIGFSNLRAMEDAEFNNKIKYMVKESEYRIISIPQTIYIWKENLNSITRTTPSCLETPQYNDDLCQIGNTLGAINFIKFLKEKKPYDVESINKTIIQHMILKYEVYLRCLQENSIFCEQNYYLAKKFYWEIYSKIESNITKEDINYIFKNGDIPFEIPLVADLTFTDFLNKIKKDFYEGEKEFKLIRSKLPLEIIQNDLKTGVFSIDD